MTSVIDPVCGMTINAESAADRQVRDGQTYYFCSRHCADNFRSEPTRYLSGKRAIGLIHAVEASPNMRLSMTSPRLQTPSTPAPCIRKSSKTDRAVVPSADGVGAVATCG